VTNRYSKATAREMPAALLRAVIRERAHHLLEGPLQRARRLDRMAEPKGKATIQDLLDVWQERDLPTEGEDLSWVRKLLNAHNYKDLENPTETLDSAQLETVRTLLAERRSIRFWDARPVPRSMLEEIIRAGQWAPCACNLQTVRVLVIDDLQEASLFKGEVSGAPAQLVICQDTRPYEFYHPGVPERNRGLDCGAAVQNMLLMAHALGLGAVWLTFTEKLIEWVRERYAIPAYLEIVTYVSVGWPAIHPIPPGRMELEAVLIG